MRNDQNRCGASHRSFTFCRLPTALPLCACGRHSSVQCRQPIRNATTRLKARTPLPVSTDVIQMKDRVPFHSGVGRKKTRKRTHLLHSCGRENTRARDKYYTCTRHTTVITLLLLLFYRSFSFLGESFSTYTRQEQSLAYDIERKRNAILPVHWRSPLQYAYQGRIWKSFQGKREVREDDFSGWAKGVHNCFIFDDIFFCSARIQKTLISSTRLIG